MFWLAGLTQSGNPVVARVCHGFLSFSVHSVLPFSSFILYLHRKIESKQLRLRQSE